MPTFRRPKRRSQLSEPLDLTSPPTEVDALTRWFGTLAESITSMIGDAAPKDSRIAALQALVAAWGRVVGVARKVEAVLRAREIREGVAWSVTRDGVDDAMIKPLWHAVSLAWLAHEVATSDSIDPSWRDLMTGHVNGVRVRETAETAAFMRHHGIRDAAKMVARHDDRVAPGPAEVEASHDFLRYGQYCTPDFRVAMHHHVIADALMRITRGDTKRLLISLPPRSGKSYLVSEHFPGFYLGNHPKRKIMHFGVTQDLAQDFGTKTLNLMHKPEHLRVFPECGLADGDASKLKFRTTQGGEYFALGIGSTGVGRGAHVGIIDDAYNDASQAASETYRRTLRDWYQATFRTRIMPGGAIVIMHTRWESGDLFGWLLDEHKREGWEVLNIPAIAEQDEEWLTSAGVWRRRVGDPMDPEWWRPGLEDALRSGKWRPQTTPAGRDPIVEYALDFEYANLRASIGARFFSALYQGAPVPGEGGTCKLSWFCRYTSPPRCARVVFSIDTAQKDGAANDHTVVMVWGQIDALQGGGHVLLDVLRERMQYPTLRTKVLDMIRHWRPHAVLIEDKNHGTTLLQDLGVTDVANHTPLIGIGASSADGNKVVKFERVTPMIEAGKVWIPDQNSACAWLADFEREIGSFPVGKNDDLVDGVQIYLNWSRKQQHTLAPGGEMDLRDPWNQAVISRIAGPWAGANRGLGGMGGGPLAARGNGSGVRFRG